MDLNWSGYRSVNPRDLELNQNSTSISFLGTQGNPSNGTPFGGDSWPNEPSSTRSLMPTALAVPHLEMDVFDIEMSNPYGDFQLNGAGGIPGKLPCSNFDQANTYD